MTPKQAAIKKTYGEHYDTYREYMDNDGWVPETAPGLPEDMSFDIYRGAWMYWRPISLRGLETNNGWISVKDRLPEKKNGPQIYWIYYSGSVIKSPFYEGRWMGGNEGITHWQPVVKPEAPIY